MQVYMYVNYYVNIVNIVVLELQPQYLRIFRTFSIHESYFKNYCHVCIYVYIHNLFIICHCTRRVCNFHQWGSAMGWTIRVWKLAGAGDYLFPKISRPPQLTQPRIHWVEWALSPELKWPGYEGDHTPLSIAELKNEWSCMSPLLVYLYGMYKDNFTFKGTSDLWL